MGPGEWIAAISGGAGFIAWMTAMWIRAGRILQRIDDIAADNQAIEARVSQHEARITRLEIVAERSQ